MTDTEQILLELMARVDALEQRNTVLEQENHVLQAKVEKLDREVLPSSGMITQSSDKLLSRRRVLHRAMQATAATVVAGVLVNRDTPEADASHSNDISANNVYAHYVGAASLDGGYGISGQTMTSVESFAGVHGSNLSTGAGMYGVSDGGRGVVGEGFNSAGVVGRGLVGVVGESGAPGYSGVYGLHTDAGAGVIGDANAADQAGVLGRNGAGHGLRGRGRIGVVGESVSIGGYGGQFEGGKAQLRLVPRGAAGKPTTGSHLKGEMLLDRNATLWICTVAGTPGTWRKVSTTTT